MRTNSWRAATLVAVVVVGGACGSGDGSGGGGTGGLRALPATGGGGASADSSDEAGHAASARASMIAPERSVEYRLADGADAPAKTATAYAIKPNGGSVKARVAKALGVDEARIEVGPNGFEWYYSGVDKDGSVTSSSSGVAVACAPDGACPEPTPPPTVPGVPSAAEAERRVKGIVADLGGSRDGRFESSGEDGYNRSVVFRPTIDGVPANGLETHIAFGREGRIEYANGADFTSESVGEYPLVGLAEALKRFQEGFGGGVRTMGGPAIATDQATSEGGVSSGGGGTAGGSTGSEPGTDPACEKGEPCSVPPSPPPDEPTMTIEPQPTDPTVPLEPEIVEVTGADLVLQLVATGCPGDAVYLVPAFELQPGPLGSVAAVEDAHLAGVGADPEQRVGEPCPGQAEPDVPMGKPEPAPMPADTGREPAKP